MSEFDKHWNEWAIASNCPENEAKIHFEAGQQSKQVEIDALKSKIDAVKNHAFINYDDERDDDHHSYWSGYNVAMCEFVDIIKGEEE